jgi:cyclic beta-1,2-glucan synthetase
LGGDLRLSLALSALVITFLAHQAWLMGDAIIRTLYRLFVSAGTCWNGFPPHRPAAGRSLDLAGFYRRWPARW